MGFAIVVAVCGAGLFVKKPDKTTFPIRKASVQASRDPLPI